MVRRTYERDAVFVEKACDLEDLVKDKRVDWRSNPQNPPEDKEDTRKDLLMSCSSTMSKNKT